MKIQTFEIENLQIVNPLLRLKLNARLFTSAVRDVLTPSPARRHVDETVFEALGLTATEREAGYAGVAESVNNRRRAQSVWYNGIYT